MKMEEQFSGIINILTNDEDSRILRQNIIDQVVNKALDSDFKSQQKKHQIELPIDERRKIAEDTLNNSHLTFLNFFGEYLMEDHLKYFKSENVNNYEINFHLHRLGRLINSKKVVSKNRRYQAMLELLKGDYFSDNEMRNREPLLWEQLVGQYLSEEEKFNYDNQYLTQNSLTEVLFEQIDRDNRDELKRKQQKEEIHKSNQDEDNDYDDDGSDDASISMDVQKPSSFWGEYSKPKNQTVKIGKRRWKEDHFLNLEQCNTKELSENERLLLLNEFKSHMIHKFLSGQDDFDYKTVDNNPEYDNLHIKAIDEEEKYFDSESPVEEKYFDTENSIEEKYINSVSPVEEMSIVENNDENDELDAYMSMLKKNEITDSVADKLKNL